MTHAIRATAGNHGVRNHPTRRATSHRAMSHRAMSHRATALCLLGLAGAGLGLGIGIGTARADAYTLTNGIAVTVADSTAPAPFSLDYLEKASLGAGTYTGVPGLTITATAGSLSGVYQGADPGYTASPFAAPGGTPPTTGPTHYLVAQADSGTVTMTYATAQTGFDLLWGTVDASPTGNVWNQLSFQTNDGTYNVTGTDIGDALTSQYGSYTTSSRNAWVQIALPTNLTFTTVVASDSRQPAFEFVPGHTGNAVTDTPEPGSLALLATALLGLGLAIRRRA